MMFIKRMRIYSLIGLNLGGITFLFCYLYSEHLIKNLNIEMALAIFAIISAIQGLLASLIYRNIKNNFPNDQISNNYKITNKTE